MTTPAPQPATGSTPVTPSPPRPGPQAARDHIPQLHAASGTSRPIITAASPGKAAIGGTTAGRAQPARTTTAVLALPSRTRPCARVDAGGTRLRLRALHVMGHGSARIARAAGASERTIRQLLSGDARTITPRLRDTITGIYDTWWDKRPPERTRAQRAAATAARRRAIAGNWCAGAALDDDDLDTPGYRPSHGWRPAHGTGTAPDIRPRTSHQHTRGRP
jgi:hypothetical protein